MHSLLACDNRDEPWPKVSRNVSRLVLLCIKGIPISIRSRCDALVRCSLLALTSGFVSGGKHIDGASLHTQDAYCTFETARIDLAIMPLIERSIFLCFRIEQPLYRCVVSVRLSSN